MSYAPVHRALEKEGADLAVSQGPTKREGRPEPPLSSDPRLQEPRAEFALPTQVQPPVLGYFELTTCSVGEPLLYLKMVLMTHFLVGEPRPDRAVHLALT